MKSGAGRLRPASAVAGLAAAAILMLWAVLPIRFGGTFGYVHTVGVSMEPLFHAGDLAVVRAQSGYGVGDVVAYRSDLLQTTVLHRIVGVQDGRFTTQGDNNSWLDPDHPAPADVLGALVLRVPQGGTWIGRATSPPVLAALAFLLVVAGGAATHRRGARGRRLSRAAQAPAPSWASWGRADGRVLAVAAAMLSGVLAVGAVVLLPQPEPTTPPATAGPATSTPATATPQSSTPGTPVSATVVPAAATGAERQIDFGYTAMVPRTAAYDATTVTAPQPVFRKLVDTLRISATYHGDPAKLAVRLRLVTPVGWTSVVPLVPATPVQDGDNLAAQVSLTELEARAKAASQYTGVQVSNVDLLVEAVVTAPGRPDWLPATKLTMTPLLLNVPGGEESLHTKQEPPKTEAPTGRGLHVLGQTIPMPRVRVLAVAVPLLALLVGLLVWLYLGAGDENARIRRRHADLLAAVAPMPDPPDRPVVDVTRFAALVRLAQRYGLLVLYWTADDGPTTYAVWDDRTVYRYRVRPAPPPPTQTPPPEPSDDSANEKREPSRMAFARSRSRAPVPRQRDPRPTTPEPSVSPRRAARAGRPAARTPAAAQTPARTLPQLRPRFAVPLQRTPAMRRHDSGVTRRPSERTRMVLGRYPREWRLDGDLPRTGGPARRAR